MSLTSATGAPINCGTFVGQNVPSQSFDKAPLASTKFRLRATPMLRVETPISITNIVVQDRNLMRFIGETLITDYRVDIDYLVPGFGFDLITITSSDTNKLLAPVNNIAQAVGTGSVVLKASTEFGDFAMKLLIVNRITGTTSEVLQSYLLGSAARHAADAIDTRIAGKDATAKPIYSTQNHSGGIYVRNTNCWAYNLDLTCISPWNSTGGNGMAGTLISPRHVLFCEHVNFHPNVGATIRFVTTNNTVVTRTITALVTHPDYSPFYPDITIGVLNADVPTGISFAKILPQNWATYFPSVNGAAQIPALVLDQEEKALVADWAKSDTKNSFSFPSVSQRQVFFENLILGDSGNPAFLIINNELVVLNTWTNGGAGAGTNLTLHKNAINNMMTSLGGGYQLTEADLSAFLSY